MFDGGAHCFFVAGVALPGVDVVVEPFPFGEHQISVNRMFYKQKITFIISDINCYPLIIFDIVVGIDSLTR